ncbi:peptidase M23 [Pseudomonas sp. RW407]|uniref:M23 family metallopeptidase n=1 Tax=Pseudomonas sp. RW407 TaxID=2202894 RepID=UPI000D6F7405|nr:M23 family metallopeptidase [Pseudomonas sp. RW407]PWU31928.1 peptidase M23 [Pseudomonas sp. RW407]
MHVLLPSWQALTREPLRLVNLRRWLLAAAGLALLLGALAFAAGLWFGRAMAPAAAVAEAAPGETPEQRFAVARLGELAGRLQVLEKDAAYLLKVVDGHEEIARKLARIDPALVPGDAAAPHEDGEGGLLLPPRPCQAAPLLDVQQGTAAARCLRRQLDLLLDAVSRRNADFLAIPTHRPVDKARLGSAFGNRVDPFNRRLAFHSGLDFAAPSGTEIQAAAGGRVVAAGPFSSYGIRVEIDHGNGLLTRYAHLSKLHVRVGEVVMPGQRIAAMGSTGRSTGSHLHFEVLYRGDFVDPQHFLSLGDMEKALDALAQD